ncbi:hypothetical protein Tco_1225208 [Tanacetum coccineum]
MPARRIYQGDKITELSHIHNRWKPNIPPEIPPIERNKIGNPISEAYMVFSIVLSLLAEYSPYVLKFIETCEEPTLMELYEVVCKAEDDLQINPSNKTNKRKANDKENDEQVTRKTDGFFYEPGTKKRTILRKEKEEEGTPCSSDDCGSTSSCKENEPKLHRRREEFAKNKPEASSDFVI